MINCGIPMGADPIWQPALYLIGCFGWAVTPRRHKRDQITPTFIMIHPDPSKDFREWIMNDEPKRLRLALTR